MAENDGKRFYWLKLKKDFFQQHQIRVLKALPNGRLYALIYLELLAESCSHEGQLRYSRELPYDVVTLAAVIDEDKDNVENAIETFERLELVEILDDNTIYMREINKLIGSETGVAERVRKWRNKEKGYIVTEVKQNCNLESRDKSIETRDKILDFIIRLEEGGHDRNKLDQIGEMMIKASNITHTIPSNETVGNLFSKLLDSRSDIYNEQGYICECFRNEGGKHD